MSSKQPHSSTDFEVQQDLTGRTLGNYELVRRLGRGGMANVYLARQTTLNRSVAVKVLKPELAIDKSYVARFHREAQAAAGLSQANIVQIIEIAEIDGIHFIAQEYVRGQNLRQYLNRNRVVEPILAVSIMRQVAAALQEASKQGVVHRDIKPENIMITSAGEVKVTDFGLARVLDDKRTDLTQIGITMGTPLYMSPEQAEGGAVDTRSDLYSLGITAWHMFTGRPPFEGENALSIAVKHVKEDVPPLDKSRPDLPEDLCAIVHKLINKSPNDRFQSPALLTKQLRSLEFDDIADWDQLTEKLAIRDPGPDRGNETQPQSRLEVTRQLETLMKGQFRPWWKSPWLLASVGLMLLAGAAAGYMYSIKNPPVTPLDHVNRPIGLVRKYPDADKQFWAAMFSNRTRAEQEELWKSVEAYFPEATFRVRNAAVNLGVFYLDYDLDDEPLADKMQRLRKARETFEQLSEIRDDIYFQKIGNAGLAITLWEIRAVNSDFSLESEIVDLLDLVKGEKAQIKNGYIRRRVNELYQLMFPTPGNTLD